MKKPVLALIALLLALLMAGCSGRNVVQPPTPPDSYSETESRRDGDRDREDREEEPASPEEEEKFTIVDAAPEDLEYHYDAVLGGVIISRYTGDAEAIRLPAQLDGDPVVQVGESGSINTSLRQIELPEGVATIGEKAFSGCTALRDVTILGNGTFVGEYAFARTSNLQNVTIPEEAVLLEHAFEDCSALRNLELPDAAGVFSLCGCVDPVILKSPERARSAARRALIPRRSRPPAGIPPASAIE